jgi:hypothetical protein
MKNYTLIFNFILLSFLSFGQKCSILISKDTICSGQSTILKISTISDVSSVKWSENDQTTNSITVTPLTNTIYTCKVTEGLNSCLATATVIVKKTPEINEVFPRSRCDTGSVILSAISNDGIINWYTTSTGGNSVNTGQNFTIKISKSTTFYVDATYNGCTSMFRTPIIATMNQKPKIGIIGNQNLCAGNKTNDVIFTSNITGTSFSWTNNNPNIGLALSGDNNITPFISLNNLDISISSVITFQGTINGCESDKSNFTITVKPLPNISNISNQSVCTGDLTDQISFISSINNSSIIWTNNKNNIGLNSSGSGTIPSFKAVNTTNTNIISAITAQATFNGCKGNQISFDFIIKPKPILSNITDQILCAGDLTKPISFISSINGSLFSWINNNPDIGLANNDLGDISSFKSINSTKNIITSKINVTASTNGCESNSIEFKIIVKPRATISIQNHEICSNSTYNNNWTGIIPSNTNYSWTVYDNPQVIGETINNNNQEFKQTITNLTLQNQKVAYTITPNTDGCKGNPFVLNLEVKPLPIVNAGNDFSITCILNQYGSEIGSTSIPGYEYNWFPTSGLSSSFTANPSANPSETTNYTLTVKDQLSNCIASDKILVTVNNTSPIADAGKDGIITCTQNKNGVTIGNISNSNYAYSWSPIIGLSTSNSSSTLANPEKDITYKITVTNLLNGCLASDQVDVSVNKITPEANAGKDLIKNCIENVNGRQIGTNQVLDYSYLWTPNIGLNSNTISNPFANPNISTIYTVLVTNKLNGCSALDQVNVEVDLNKPFVNAGSDFTKTCIYNASGSLIGMAALPNINYTWNPSIGLNSNLIANPIANPNSTTTYTMTATSLINGCVATDEVLVNVNQIKPQVNAGNDFIKNCIQNINGNEIGVKPSFGMLYSYSWFPNDGLSKDNIANPIANPNQTTLYTLTISDLINGCSSSDKVLVNVNTNLPTVYAGIDASITCDQNTSGFIIGMQPELGVSYSWSPSFGLTSSNQSQVIANPTNSTDYTLTGINKTNGCINTDNVSINVDKLIPYVNAGNDIKLCEGQTVKLTGSSNANIINWEPKHLVVNHKELTTEAKINNTSTFTLIAKSNNGCIATDEITVQISDNPLSGLSKSYEICQNDQLKLSAPSNLVCEWSGIYKSLENNVSIEGIKSGELKLKMSNNYGCTSNENITVIVNSIPNPVIYGLKSVCQNSYWKTYSIPTTSNNIKWNLINGEFISNSNTNEVVVHWGLGKSGKINVTETNQETGCSNFYNQDVMFENNIALDTTDVLQLTNNVLYTPKKYSIMNWGYESIQTKNQVTTGVNSQYFRFSNFDPTQYYYWVEIGEDEECTTKSYFNNPKLVTLNEIFDKKTFLIYPNPIEDHLNIITELDEFTYQIINSNGQILVAGNEKKSITIKNLEIPSGLYLLNIISKEKMYRHKIIKI